MQNNWATIIVAAGAGTRFGSEMLKQYAPLCGKPVMSHSIDLFLNHGPVALVVDPTHAPYFPPSAPNVIVVEGGKTRQDSVLQGLKALKTHAPDFVIIHDAARPLVTNTLVKNIKETIEQGAKSATLALKIPDTLMRGAEVIDRNTVHAIQTPQAFNYQAILDAHTQAISRTYTDDASLLLAETGIEAMLVEGSPDNFKITTRNDIERAEKIMALNSETRVGLGYDVHAFGDAPESGHIKLFGTDIPSDRKLIGHSDADAGLHALADAILGTIGAGDIGVYFPPSDPQWAGMDSADIVKKAMEILSEKGGKLVNVDVTLLAQAPRITPHRDAILHRLSTLLNLPVGAIGLKATTTEGLGFIGRHEGLAVQAIATIRLIAP
jgi:2-C-methyl-D-erythritol 4-phosphate cytidylyltransferase/2-C-methyl-D-erythritol 2,4-cyclodiphosphate synthase